MATFQFKWPEAVKGLFAIFDATSAVGDNVLSLPCALPTYSGIGGHPVYARTLVVLLIPAVLFIIITLFWLLRVPAYRKGESPIHAPTPE